MRTKFLLRIRMLPTALAAFAGALPAYAAFDWPGCGEVKESEFRYQAIVGRGALGPKVTDDIREPIKMAFDLQADGATDIYWVERLGKIKRYAASRNQVVTLGALGVVTAERNEQGLFGIALDPGFKSNRWMYLFYTPSAENDVWRMSRFTLNADFTSLDPASEKVLLRIPSQRVSCCHTGGGMQFDAYGDLWVAVGKNSPDHPNSINEGSEVGSTEGTSADGTDLRGGIIRIRPDNSARGYSVPKGNYGEYWSEYFRAKGNAAVAAEYADTTKVKAEIYVKGARNPYSLTLDPYRRWVTWGEFGVNLDATMTEEHNLVTHPVFGGYPYFAGGGGTGGTGCTYVQGMCELWRSANNSPGEKDRNAPVNNSKWNKGPKLLPPVEPALHTYPRSGAITGPIYRYHGNSPSKIKWPPHFDKAWMVGDHSKNWLKIYKVDETGTRLTDSLTWFASKRFYDLLDIQQGPDGAIYFLNYSGNRSYTAETHIGRYEYTGTCLPEAPTVALPGRSPSQGEPGVRMLAGRLAVDGTGEMDVRITDSRGALVSSFRASAPFTRDLAGGRGAGMRFVTLKGAWGSRSWTLVSP